MKPRLNLNPRGGYTQIDLYVFLFLTILIAALLTLGSPRMHHDAGRLRCAANLKQIGHGLALYANDNGGHYPRTIYDPSDPTVRAYTGAKASNPFGPGGPQPNDVTAAMYLLLRTEDLTSAVFICNMAVWQEPLLPTSAKADELLLYSNFPSEQNLSYSIANPYPSAAAYAHGYRWTNTISADFAIAADMNPGSSALTTLTPSSKQNELKRGNSLNHSWGQNVLYGDYHVEFQTTPFAGTQQDNIYGPGGLLDAGKPTERVDPVMKGNVFSASPAHKYDSVLLPVATSRPRPAEPGPFWIWWNSNAREFLSWTIAIVTVVWVSIRWGIPRLKSL